MHTFKKSVKILLHACCALILGFLMIPIQGQALTECQRKIHESNISYYNCEETKFVSCNGNAALTGSENTEIIWNFFRSQGFQPNQAAGIMGNMKAEAGFEPRLVEYGWPNSRGETSVQGEPSSLDEDVPPNANGLGQPGYGLIQWTSPGRKQGLRDIAAENAVKASDLGTQLKYVMRELQGAYKSSAYDPLMASTSVEEATDIILENYEIPGDIEGQRPVRRGFAQEILTQYGSSGGGGSSSPGSSSCGSGSGGEVVGGYSLPLDRRFYDENPGSFSGRHHEYPAVDIAVAEGTKVYAISAGTIRVIAPGSDCGNGVIVDRGDGVQFKYCHGKDGGSVESASDGDRVNAGQLVMYSGNTGVSSGPHLHVEVIIDNTNRCPGPLFDGIAQGSPPDLRSLPTSGCVE